MRWHGVRQGLQQWQQQGPWRRRVGDAVLCGLGALVLLAVVGAMGAVPDRVAVSSTSSVQRADRLPDRARVLVVAPPEDEGRPLPAWVGRLEGQLAVDVRVLSWRAGGVQVDRDAAGDERRRLQDALRERAPDVVLLVPAGLPEEAGPATQAVRTLLQDVRAALPASRSAVLAAVTGDGAQDARLARAVRAAGAAERVGVVDPTGAGWYAGPYAGLVPGGPQTTDAAAAEAYTARRLAHALAPLVNAALEGKPVAPS